MEKCLRIDILICNQDLKILKCIVIRNPSVYIFFIILAFQEMRENLVTKLHLYIHESNYVK